ncbi:MAG: EAL domain-containing protein [Kordiimonadaceae bacterium]|nr:EAL domain-containing protein [Kordiimonadaceae bacterium]
MPDHVLVVDDSATTRSTLEHVLDLSGFEVTCAKDGAEAVLELERSHFDFVVTDIAMPNMDGYELLRKMAELKERRPGVIVMSEKGQHIINTGRELAQAYSMNFLGVLPKPIDQTDLLKLLRHVARPRVRPKSLFGLEIAESAFLRGMQIDALSAVFQPKVNCIDGSLNSVECLARWKTAHHGLLGPETFLPIAVRKGHMHLVTKKMLTLALRQWGYWAKRGSKLHVAVNVSPQDVCRLELVDEVRIALIENDVSPEYLTLELTETEHIENTAVALEVMGRLRLMGIKLALDDFGTGIDPLLRLKSMPFNELKADQPFLQDAMLANPATVILTNTISLARRLGMTSTCEGVETIGQWNLTRMLNATCAQGYFIAPPMSSSDLINWVRDWNPVQLMSLDTNEDHLQELNMFLGNSTGRNSRDFKS